MHSALIAMIAVGVFFGWVWKRCHGAWQDWRGSIARMKGARAVFRREARVTLVVAVIALAVLRALV